VLVCLAGCLEPNSAGTIKTSTRRIDTPAGMIEYLQGQNLPALKSVEVWQNTYGPGLKLTTAHYEIFTTLLEPLMLNQVPGFVESAYHRGYNSQLPKPIETTSKSPVYLFAERKQWEDFTKTFAGPRAPIYHKIKAGAYYLNGACVAYNIAESEPFLFLDTRAGTSSTKSILNSACRAGLTKVSQCSLRPAEMNGDYFILSRAEIYIDSAH